MSFRKTSNINAPHLAAWLRQYHRERVEHLVLHYPKDVAAKLLREQLHEQGITHGAGVYLSRGQIRRALTEFRRPSKAERAALGVVEW